MKLKTAARNHSDYWVLKINTKLQTRVLSTIELNVEERRSRMIRYTEGWSARRLNKNKRGLPRNRVEISLKNKSEVSTTNSHTLEWKVRKLN